MKPGVDVVGVGHVGGSGEDDAGMVIWNIPHNTTRHMATSLVPTATVVTRNTQHSTCQPHLIFMYPRQLSSSTHVIARLSSTWREEGGVWWGWGGGGGGRRGETTTAIIYNTAHACKLSL